MGSKARKKQIWGTQLVPLTPLMEGPDPEMQEEGNKKDSSWEVIREWFRAQKGYQGSSNLSLSSYGCNIPAKRQDLRLLLGVLGCPLAPIPQVNDRNIDHLLHLKEIPFVSFHIYFHKSFQKNKFFLVSKLWFCDIKTKCLRILFLHT